MPGACCSGDFCLQQLDQDSCEVLHVGRYFEGFSCDQVDCTIPSVVGACCLPDDSGCVLVARRQLFTTDPLGCYELGGEFAGEGVQCEIQGVFPPLTVCDPEPPPVGCITAREDRSTGKPAWSVDGCQNMFLQPEEPADDDEQGNWGIVSPHKVRALPGNVLTEEDPCAFHRGALVIDGDGYARAAMCSQPNFAEDGTRQWSLSDVFIVDQDPNGMLSPGAAVWMGSYAPPLFTEAHLRSHKRRCNLLR